MGYTPPSCEELRYATAELQQIFNKQQNRYDPPSYELLTEKLQSMERSYRQRVKEKPNLFFALQPDSVRFEEISCITHLMDSVQSTTAQSSARNQIHGILLGALIYRWKAIDASYQGSISSRFKLNSARSSALYLTIEEILMLNSERGNQLDPLTVSTCCAAYQKRLLELGAVRGSVYIRENEVDFFQTLDLFISEADGASRGVSEQMGHLVAIQSVDECLEKMCADTSSGLVLLSSVLSKGLNRKDRLSREEMMQSLETIELSPLVKSMIEYLVPDDKCLNKESLVCFLDEMKPRLAIYYQYALLGAYVIVLKNTPPEHSKLIKTLNIAIGSLSMSNALDDETRLRGLSVLGHYLTLPGVCDLDFKAWRSYNSLKRDVEHQYIDLQRMSELAQSLVM